MPRADRRDLTTCPACEGHGRFLSDNGPAPAEYQCDTCFGSGTFDADDLGVIIQDACNRFAREWDAPSAVAERERMRALCNATIDRNLAPSRARQAARWAAEDLA